MLDNKTFKTVIENTPLVSIDICLVCDGMILLGKRNNEPLKGQWFTLGGRILKNESWQSCLSRIASSEMGMILDDLNKLKLMGIWDHVYKNSVVSESVSTHYVNLPHYMHIRERPELKIDDQHSEVDWFCLEDIAGNSEFHEYIRNYALWLIEEGVKID